MLQPLTDLIKGDDKKHNNNTKVEIPQDAKEAIELVKRKLTEAPILAFPRWKSEEPFNLYTDASAVATACIITQVQDKQERVIMYGSRAV